MSEVGKKGEDSAVLANHQLCASQGRDPAEIESWILKRRGE